MKMIALVSAGLAAAAALGSAGVANAAPPHGWHTKRVCRTTIVHHHKVRRCRTQRVRW